MRPADGFRLAGRAIRSHPLRSTLTTIGIVIGVAAVITFVILGASLQDEIIGEVGGEEATTINVWAGPEGTEGGPGAGAQPVFTERDVTELAELDGVDSVVPYGPVPTTAVTYQNETVSRSDALIATAPGYLGTDDLAEGRLFEPGEREAVINPAAAESFEENVSVGDELTVTLADGERETVTVVGLLDSSEGQSAFEGFGEVPRTYVSVDPLYTTMVESPSAGENQRVYAVLFVIAEDPERVDESRETASDYLVGESDAAELAPAEYAFELRTNEELLDQLRELLDTLTAFVTGIAVISLVVGSIGIANIMLVSVTERTREIGIMKAVGAQRREILGLFLVEAVVLGVVGAILGVVVGLLGGYLGARYVDLPMAYPVEWFAVAVVVGVLVGVGSGLYPAWRAARTDPIDALRYE